MQSESEHDPTLKAFEAALGHLTPALTSFDRDRVLFEAGKKSQRSHWLLSSSLIVSAAAWLGLGLAWFLATPAIQERVVFVQVPTPAAAVATNNEPEPQPQELSWLRLNEALVINQTLPRSISIVGEGSETDQTPTTAGLPVTSRYSVPTNAWNWPFPWSFRP
jgi:hypothetical protein